MTLAQTMVDRWPSGFAHQALGVQLAAAGRSGDAIDQLRAAVPTFSPAQFDLGVELYKAGRLDDAAAALESFITDEPEMGTQGRVHTALGLIRQGQKRDADARREFELAIAAKDPDLPAHGRLAELLLAEGAFAQAAPHFQAYVTLEPNDAGAYAGLGICLFNSGKPADGIAAFRRAEALDGRNGAIREDLAMALLDSGDIEAGAREAGASVELRPNSATAHELLGRAFEAQGRLAEARSEFQLAAKLK